MVDTYRKIVEAGFTGHGALSATLVSATPILFTGLAAAAAFRMQLFNIGAEGQLYLGAIGASWIALQLGDHGVDLDAAVRRRDVRRGGACSAALWALIPGVLRAFANTNEIITSLMLNYVAGLPAHVPHLRQLVLLARHVDAPGAGVPAGEADARGRRSGRRSARRVVVPLGFLVGLAAARRRSGSSTRARASASR